MNDSVVVWPVDVLKWCKLPEVESWKHGFHASWKVRDGSGILLDLVQGPEKIWKSM